MIEDDFDFLPLKATHVGRGGKRSFDPGDRRRLVKACRRPGVSVSSMALKAGVNANQLRRWIRADGKTPEDTPAILVIENAPTAFVPVVEIGAAKPFPVRHEPAPATPAPSPPLARLVAQLPNGAKVELECTGRDAALVAAMIKALGAA
jgi:transposase